MPTYTLDENRSARLPRGVLTIRLTSDQRARLSVTAQGHELVGLVRPTATMLVVPRVPERALIAVAPDAARATFEPGTVSITISVGEDAGANPDLVVIEDVEVSGLRGRDLAVLESDASGVVVTGMVGAGLAAPLASDLADGARVATREILGVERVPAEEAVGVVVAVDHSASMARHHVNGSVRAAVDLVVGVATVTATERGVTAHLLGAPPVVARAREDEDLGARLQLLAAGRPPTVGLRSVDAAHAAATAGPASLFLVTDAVPADVDALAAACAPARLSPHLILLGERSALEPELRAVGLPCTVLERSSVDGGGESPGDERVALVAAVRSLVRTAAPGRQGDAP